MSEPVVPDTRFTLALERTLLAWIRTALALMGLGFIVARLPLFVGDLISSDASTSTTPGISRSIGVGLVCLAVLVQVIALYEYQRNSARVKRGETLMPTLWSAVGILGMVLAAAGLALAAYLIGLSPSVSNPG